MKALSDVLGINLFDKAPRGLKPSGVGRVYGARVALIPQSASRFQPPGVLFKPLTGDLLHVETALFVREDQMRTLMKDFIVVALSGITALKLNSPEKRWILDAASIFYRMASFSWRAGTQPA